MPGLIVTKTKLMLIKNLLCLGSAIIYAIDIIVNILQCPH